MVAYLPIADIGVIPDVVIALFKKLKIKNRILQVHLQN
jgi:hypothetical protein